MANRSSFVMETNQKDSRTVRQKPAKKQKNHRDYDSEPRFHSYDKKDKYKSWKHQIEEDWDE